jgi:hypothetical protein
MEVAEKGSTAVFLTHRQTSWSFTNELGWRKKGVEV